MQLLTAQWGLEPTPVGTYHLIQSDFLVYLDIASDIQYTSTEGHLGTICGIEDYSA